MDDDSENNWATWVAIIGGIIGVVLVGSVLGGNKKYEGQTAKEWFYDYAAVETDYQNLKDDHENLKDCIDTLHNQLDEIHTKAGLAGSDYDDMEDALFSIRLNTDPECGY